MMSGSTSTRSRVGATGGDPSPTPVASSHRVLSFLSEHSTRDPGVCLDEIAIAVGVKGGNIQTVLGESEEKVKPPASISHIQWLDMQDWKERRDRSLGLRPEDRAAAKGEWEKSCEEKLREIIAVTESDESRRFAGEIEELANHLKPISSDSRIHQLLRRRVGAHGWSGRFTVAQRGRLHVPSVLYHGRSRHRLKRIRRGPGALWPGQSDSRPELYKEMGAQEDYSGVYRFPCCGKYALMGNWGAPSQYRADGCRDASS